MRVLGILLLSCALLSTAQADLIGHHPNAARFYLSADKATVASVNSSEMRFWNVSKRSLSSKLNSPDFTENGDLSLSGDGKRVLLRQKTGVGKFNKLPFGFRLILYRQVGSQWKAGSVVAPPTFGGSWPLDTEFDGQELLVLWPDRVERFGANGKLRSSVKFRNPSQSRDTEKLSKWTLGSFVPKSQSVMFSQGKLSVFYSIETGRQLRKWERDEDYGIAGWFFSPKGRHIDGWNRYQEDGDWRSVEESDDWIWDSQTGKLECHIPYDNLPAPRFWSPAGDTLLEGLYTDADTSDQQQTFRARDACDHERIFTFPRSWPAGRTIEQYRFSDDGQMLVVMDEKHELWVENLQ